MADPRTSSTLGLPDSPKIKPAVLGKRNRTSRNSVIALGVILLGFAGWYFLLRTPAKAPLVVRYAAVDMGDLSRGVTATGTLQATTTVQVGSQVSGLITNLYADFNTKVKKGQLLATLDPATYEAQVTQAKANVAKANADLHAAELDEKRQAELLSRKLIAQSDYDASRNKLDDAKASLQQADAQLKQAEANLGYTVIRSPISGVVVTRNVDKGQTVAAGLNVSVLFVIAEDLTSMQVSANVDEADIGQVKVDQPVHFTVDAYPGEQFEGKVSQVRINSVVTQNVVTYAVIIRTNNPDGRLLPGMTATVNIVNASRDSVKRVPISATRFVPPQEMLDAAGISDSSLRMGRRNRPGGDSGRRAGGPPAGGGARGGPGAGQGAQGGGAWRSGERPTFARVYMKTMTPQGPSIKPVRIIGGLADGNYLEVLKSDPELKVGDSLVVAAFSLQPSSPAGSSPLNNRPAQPGGGGMRRF